MKSRVRFFGGIPNAPSYFSRMKIAPSILLELTKGIPENANIDSNCKQVHAEGTCSYFVRPHLQEYLPYFLRLMEITAFSKRNNLSTPKNFKYDFATVETAKNILVSENIFFSKLSLIDMQLRLRTSNNISIEKFKNFVASQALGWEPHEQARVEKMLSWIEDRMNSLKLNFKLPKITFIKTTGKEEANFPYTRNNSIILPVDTIYSQDLLFTICHEIFHIYTRNNPQKRAELYALVGFKELNENLLSVFIDRKKVLTNPDVTDENVSISVLHQNQTVDVIPLILSKISENMASQNTVFSQNVEFRLWIPGTKLIDPAETNYSQVSGANTDFDFHPEEILAENFAFLLTRDTKIAKTPGSIVALMNYLQK